jgi:hypothetical protein
MIPKLLHESLIDNEFFYYYTASSSFLCPFKLSLYYISPIFEQEGA